MNEYIVKVPDWFDSEKLAEAIHQYFNKSDEFDSDEDRFYVRENDMIY